jgi:hypothetical protein
MRPAPIVLRYSLAAFTSFACSNSIFAPYSYVSLNRQKADEGCSIRRIYRMELSRFYELD